jgi:hypothetical protein
MSPSPIDCIYALYEMVVKHHLIALCAGGTYFQTSQGCAAGYVTVGNSVGDWQRVTVRVDVSQEVSDLVGGIQSWKMMAGHCDLCRKHG